MPDSNHLMIVAQDGGAADQAFFMVDRSTGDVTRLFSVNTPDHHRSAAGALSPDGRTLYASVRMNAASPWSHVVAIDLTTGKEGVAIEIPGGFPPFSDAPALAVSPDGSFIAVQGSTGGAHSRIVTLSLTGAAPHVTVPDFLPVGTQIDEKLRWTDNGQSLLFVARAATSGSHSWKLMRVPAAGGPAQVDYDSDATDIKWGKPWSLDVSPDGRRFVVAGSIEGHVELWSLDLASALNAR
jgi:Tol biopolymer transport system component